MQVTASLKQVRDRIASVKNTKKITDAMKLVAAAKVRRAQDAVINGRPFAENLVKVSISCVCNLPISNATARQPLVKPAANTKFAWALAINPVQEHQHDDTPQYKIQLSAGILLTMHQGQPIPLPANFS